VGNDPPPAEVVPIDGIAPPDWLKDGGLTVWNRLAPRLAEMNILTRTDTMTFARYCRNFARWLEMNKRLDDMGEIYEIETASGVVRRPDPAYLIADRLERQLLSAEANFGLNPAERQRLFAMRAAAGAQGQLFQPAPPSTTGSEVAAEAPSASGSPVGLLN